MDVGRAIVLTTACVIGLATLLTGPAIGFFDVRPANSFTSDELGTGEASVTAVEFPGNPTLSDGTGDSNQYVLRTGDVEVNVANVTGQPMLVYKLEIHGMGYTKSSLTVLDTGMSGPQAIQLSRATIHRETVTAETYPSELRLVFRGDGPDRVVGSTNVTVQVDP